VQAGVSTATMFREALRPMFLLLLFCMFLTASTELAPGRWVGVFIKDIINVQGILFLVYTSALMFVLRFFAGTIARFLSPFGLLVISSVLSFVGLLSLSYSTTLVTVIISETIFGLGVTYFWPTMLGVTSERFPKGGAFLLGVIGAAGGLFLSYVAVPTMGKIDDHYALKGLPQGVQEKVVVGGRVDDKLIRVLPEAERAVIEEQVDAAEKHAASLTFRWVAIMPVILILVFGVLWLRDVMAGGYKEEKLTRAG
jgi:MFS family permease